MLTPPLPNGQPETAAHFVGLQLADAVSQLRAAGSLSATEVLCLRRNASRLTPASWPSDRPWSGCEIAARLAQLVVMGEGTSGERTGIKPTAAAAGRNAGTIRSAWDAMSPVLELIRSGVPSTILTSVPSTIPRTVPTDSYSGADLVGRSIPPTIPTSVPPTVPPTAPCNNAVPSTVPIGPYSGADLTSQNVPSTAPLSRARITTTTTVGDDWAAPNLCREYQVLGVSAAVYWHEADSLTSWVHANIAPHRRDQVFVSRMSRKLADMQAATLRRRRSGVHVDPTAPEPQGPNPLAEWFRQVRAVDEISENPALVEALFHADHFADETFLAEALAHHDPLRSGMEAGQVTTDNSAAVFRAWGLPPPPN